MHELNFSRLNNKLLLGGVAPKYAQRIITELESHLIELTTEEEAQGVSKLEARETAMAKLGKEDVIVSEALAKPEIQSWSRRYTKLMFLIAPPLLYVLAIFSLLFIWTVVVRDFFAIDPFNEWPLWNYWITQFLAFGIEHLFTPILLAMFAMLAIRRNVQMHWPMLGIGVMCMLGAGWDTSVFMSSDPREGGFTLTWGYAFLPWRYVQIEWAQTFEQLARFAVYLFILWQIPKHYNPLKLRSE